MPGGPTLCRFCPIGLTLTKDNRVHPRAECRQGPDIVDQPNEAERHVGNESQTGHGVKLTFYMRRHTQNALGPRQQKQRILQMPRQVIGDRERYRIVKVRDVRLPDDAHARHPTI
jgi:hypothetical protein